MNSVTDIIKSIEQPRGGYLPVRNFEVEEIGGEPISTSLPPILVGKVLDSMIHITAGCNVNELLKDSIKGYEERVLFFAQQFRFCKDIEETTVEIKAEDDILEIHSLISRIDRYMREYDFYYLALVLTLIHQYDIWSSDFNYISRVTNVSTSRPKYYNKGDIRKLVTMYQRSIAWICTLLDKGIIFDYKFYPSGYTEKIKYGVGDFVCNNTLFDLKCTKNEPTSYHTLQILVYYVMGLHSNNKLYKNIKYLGIYSPITNKVWKLDVKSISKELIHKVSREVIGYNE